MARLCSPYQQRLAGNPDSRREYPHDRRGEAAPIMGHPILGSSEGELYFRSCLMIGRAAVGEAMVLNPARAKVVAYPVLEALGVLAASRGEASSAWALASFAA